MRIPKSEFTDADLKLCHAHGDAVANEPDHVLWARMFGNQTAEHAAAQARGEAIMWFETEICMPADLPLPPSYWDDLEHWLKTLAPAKPAVSQPCQAPTTERRYYERQPDGSVHDVEPEPAADVWHSEAPSVAGVYIADTKECVAESSERASRWRRYFDGVLWSNAWLESMHDIDKARTRSLRTGADILWLRLIEADAPSAKDAS